MVGERNLKGVVIAGMSGLAGLRSRRSVLGVRGGLIMCLLLRGVLLGGKWR